MDSFARTLGIIDEATAAKLEGITRALEFVAISPQSAAGKFACGAAPRRSRPLESLWQEGFLMQAEARKSQSITHWPFENFWTNPYEPLHSRLLGYLLDPRENHGCGERLLQSLIATLQKDGKLPSDREFMIDQNCRVRVEEGHVDLSIESECGPESYAIIIENKINGAQNRKKQLEGYVLHFLKRRGFQRDHIFVLYLPLTDDKQPASEDLAAIEQLGVKHALITFETHIMEWLQSALNGNPLHLPTGMLENLSHYRNLLSYWLHLKKSQTNMDKQLLQKLAQTPDTDPQPTWQEAVDLENSATSLRRCIEARIRGNLLLRISERWKEEGHKSWFFQDVAPDKVIATLLPYDERLLVNMNVCRQVEPGVCVGIGGNRDEMWIGYSEDSGKPVPDVYREAILEEATEKLSNPYTKDPAWYAWSTEPIDFKNCDNTTADELAERLEEMALSLCARLRKLA